MDNQNIPSHAVYVGKLNQGEKLPKWVFKRYPKDEEQNGITEFRCSASKAYQSDRYTDIKVTGELHGKTTRYTLMIFLVYNANEELIETNYKEKLDDDFDGKKTFSVTLQVPSDEYVSKIAVRFIPDPVFL